MPELHGDAPALLMHGLGHLAQPSIWACVWMPGVQA
jgi:hypothetical protein